MRTIAVQDALSTRGTKSGTIFRRLADGDRSAARECVKTYGGLVWTLALKFTDTSEKAEAVTEEIFKDLWSRCHDLRETHVADADLIAVIAVRRLMKLGGG